MRTKTETDSSMRFRHRLPGVDLTAACRAFVAVASRGSFTLGAASIGVPQPVASRRVAALEKHLGGVLLDRTTRGGRLTALGRAVLPAARRVTLALDDLELAAEHAVQVPARLVLPSGLSVGTLAWLVTEAREAGRPVAVQQAGPARRREQIRNREVDAAVVTVPEPDARWVVPLGVASAVRQDRSRLYLDELRPRRGDTGREPRRVWVMPEDDVAHVADVLVRAAVAAGCRPSQVCAGGMVDAVAAAMGGQDLLLCGRHEAADLQLAWTPLAAPRLVRGYTLATEAEDDAVALAATVGRALAQCLGAQEKDL